VRAPERGLFRALMQAAEARMTDTVTGPS
jgi:hypothetical protein